MSDQEIVVTVLAALFGILAVPSIAAVIALALKGIWTAFKFFWEEMNDW